MDVTTHTLAPTPLKRCIPCSSTDTASSQGIRFSHTTPQSAAAASTLGSAALFKPTRSLVKLDGTGGLTYHALRFLSGKERLEIAPVCKTFNEFARKDNICIPQRRMMTEIYSLITSSIRERDNCQSLDEMVVMGDTLLELHNSGIAPTLAAMGEIDMAIKNIQTLPVELKAPALKKLLALIMTVGSRDDIEKVINRFKESARPTILASCALQAHTISGNFDKAVKLLPQIKGNAIMTEMLPPLLFGVSREKTPAYARKLLQLYSSSSPQLALIGDITIKIASGNIEQVLDNIHLIEDIRSRIQVISMLLFEVVQKEDETMLQRMIPLFPWSNQLIPVIKILIKFQTMHAPEAIAEATAETNTLKKIEKLMLAIQILGRDNRLQNMKST